LIEQKQYRSLMWF